MRHRETKCPLHPCGEICRKAGPAASLAWALLLRAPWESSPSETSRGSGTGPSSDGEDPALWASVIRELTATDVAPVRQQTGASVVVDHFAAGAVLAFCDLRTRDREWRPTQPLLHEQNTNRDAKTSSAACAYNRLDRIMVAAALRHTDTTAASICTWRYQVTFDTQGGVAAELQFGYLKQHLLTRIVLPIATDSAKANRTNALWDTFAA